MKKGPLIKVQLAPGQYVKMYQADAIAKGLIEPPATKMQPPAQNKMRQPEAEKTPEPEPADDFTEIPGVGPATARALAAHGITTFEQLRQAGELDYVTAATMAAIEAWRDG